jgi:hypothetical protein
VIWIWDTATGRQLVNLQAEYLNEPEIAFSPDGLRLAAVSNDGLVFWEAAPHRSEARRVERHPPFPLVLPHE